MCCALVSVALGGTGFAATAAAATFTSSAPFDVADGSGGAPPYTPGTGAQYPSTIAPSGLTGTVSDVNVTLHGVTHAVPDDLDVMLEGPGGQRVVILSDSGESTPIVSEELAFDDSAATFAPDTTGMPSGTYKPTNNFGGLGEPADGNDPFVPPAPGAPRAATLAQAFNGSDPNGTWRLYVVDDRPGQTGSLSGWSLDIQPSVAPPPPAPGAPPVASFKISPALPCTGDPVTFDASASHGFTGSGRLTYSWSIGAATDDQPFRNPEDAFRSSLPVLTHRFGPLRKVEGFTPSKDTSPGRGDGDYISGGIVYGKHYRVPLAAILYVTDEAGVTKQTSKIFKFGDAGYRPQTRSDFNSPPPGNPLPPGPKPRCPRYRVPPAVTLASGGLVANGPNTSVVVRCPRPADCIGRVTLSTAAAPRSRTLKLASRSFILNAGRKRKVALKLSKAGQRLLRKKRKLPVTVKVVATNQSRKTAVTQRRTTLRRLHPPSPCRKGRTCSTR